MRNEIVKAKIVSGCFVLWLVVLMVLLLVLIMLLMLLQNRGVTVAATTAVISEIPKVEQIPLCRGIGGSCGRGTLLSGLLGRRG